MEGPAERSGVRGLLLASVAAALAAASGAAAAQEEPDDAGFTISADALGIELGGRMQLQTVTSPCSEPPFEADSPCAREVPVADMLIRRARLSVEIDVSELIDAKIQPEFGSIDRIELKDAWGRLDFHPAFRLKLGHFKRPFDGFQLTSSTRILTIERDLDIPGVPALRAASLDEFTTRFRVSDRDVGVVAQGTPGDTRFRYWLGVFNGQGPTDDRDVNDAKQVVGRAQYTFRLGDSLPLKVAAAAATTDLPLGEEDDQPEVVPSEERYGNYELWAELGEFAPGPHVQAGLLLGENPLQRETGDPVAAAQPGTTELATALAWQVIGSYRFRAQATELLAAVEPVFRVSRADPNTDLENDQVWGFTPGVQVFFSGRNKIALNWDVVAFGADDLETTSSFKAQFQAHF